LWSIITNISFRNGVKSCFLERYIQWKNNYDSSKKMCQTWQYSIADNFLRLLFSHPKQNCMLSSTNSCLEWMNSNYNRYNRYNCYYFSFFVQILGKNHHIFWIEKNSCCNIICFCLKWGDDLFQKWIINCIFYCSNTLKRLPYEF